MERLAILLLALVVGSSVLPASIPVNSTSDVESRILRGIAFLQRQFHSGGTVAGYLHLANSSEMHALTEDNALTVLALSGYQESHFSSAFYSDLRRAVAFVDAAQAGGGDFYGYYDFGKGAWSLSGRFYYWNAIVLMSLGYAAFTITNQVNSERGYWAGVAARLVACSDRWLPSGIGENGGVTFALSNGSEGLDVGFQGAILMGLMYLALFEYYWGSRDVGDRLFAYAKPMASWLFSLQERDLTRWGRGGFYSNASKSFQPGEGNGFAMLGLNGYYKTVQLFTPTTRLDLEGMRGMMQDWEEGYVEKSADSYGGVAYGRGANGPIAYPKLTWTTAATLAATVDVWINLGPPKYWNDSSKIYSWLTGNNERSTDIQTPQGDFQGGIAIGGRLLPSDLGDSMLMLFAVIQAAFVSIPGTYPVTNAKQRTTETVSSENITLTQSNYSTTKETNQSAQNLQLYAITGLVILALMLGLVAYKRTIPRKAKRSSKPRKARTGT